MSLTTITKHRVAARVAAGAVGIAMALSGVAVVASKAYAAALTPSQIQSILSLLSSFGADQTTINNVSASLNGQPTSGTGSSSTGYTFSKDLTVGSTGADVMNLQKVLNGSADTQVSASGAGSPGNETSYFGNATKAAVIKFQTKNGISPAVGYVGPLTRASLNSMSGGTTTGGTTGGTTTPPPAAGTGLSVSAAVQPAASLAPKGANRVPFTNFTLTAGNDGDVTVTGITVQRTGLAQDAAFAGVVLIDTATGQQVDIAKTFNSNHQATVGGTFTIPKGTTKSFQIAGNMASSLTSYVGQIATLDVVGVNTSAAVSGSLPITGTGQTLNNSLAVGTVTIGTSSFDPNVAGSQPIGTTDYRFTGFRITAGSTEDLTLHSIRWNQTGSAASSDLANVVTVVNGTNYPTTLDTTGKYYTSTFTGVTVTKGNSIDVYIKGDVIGSGAASRVAEFDLYKNTDVYLTGNTYGYGITGATGSGTVSTSGTHATVINTSSNPWLQGSTLSITAGSVTSISKANEVAAQNIAVNVPSQALGGFATNFLGEPISVQSLYFSISTTSGSLPTTAASPYSAITSVSLVDENGTVVAGPIDAGLADGSTAHGNVISAATSYAWLNFTDTVTFPTGRHVYTLKGKIPAAWGNNTVVNIYTKPSTDWTSVTGQTTGNTISLSGQSTAITMNTMTVKAAALDVSVSTQPASQNVTAGSQGLTIGNYQLDASASGEDIRLSSFPVIINTSSGDAGDLTGCQLYNGATVLNTGANVVNTYTDNTSKTYSLDQGLTVPKGTVLNLTLKCNVSSAAAADNTYILTLDSTAANYSVTGVTSGNAVTPTLTGNSTGGTMTTAAGSVTMAVDNSSPNYTVVASNATGVTVGVIRFRAANEAANLSKVGLILTSGAASQVGTVYLYDGATQVGTATFTGTATTATSTLSSVVSLPKDTNKLLTIKADLISIGTGLSGASGKIVQIDPLNAQASGASSGSTLNSAATAAVNGIRAFKSYPTIALDTLQTTGIADGDLMRFKVTANSSGPVGLYTLDVTLATSSFVTGGGVTSLKVNVYADSGYSQAVSGTYGAATGQFGATNGTTGGTLLTNGPTVIFRATTNALQIPAGTTYYFKVVGTVASTQSGTSVSTTLNGDAAYIVAAHLGSINMSTTTGANADTNNDFIWSDNATTTTNITGDQNWTNGYGVPGLPSGGLTFTRSN